jgi:tetratricopeptide (TPR) repeat protein
MGESPRILLVLMVKNEATVIERCLRSASPFVDSIFVFDTGSTDDTMEVARRLGCATKREEWLDFGRSRTASLRAARLHVVRVLGWKLRETFALVLDADMELQGDPALFRTYLHRALEAGASSLNVEQKMGSLVYSNTRLMLLADAWHCKGATHEFWTGGRDGRSAHVDQSILWIRDVGDGGCKDDKFERDARLLRAALEEEPGDARSLFYLAQTYKDLRRPADAIAYYLRRIEAAGWTEEVWYSHYGIAQCHAQLGQFKEAAKWVKRASEVCKDRAEPAMFLCRALRLEGARIWREDKSERPPPETSALFEKAWRYVDLCGSLPLPGTHRLFVEPDAYGSNQWLEKSHLAFYGRRNEPEVGMLAALSCEGSGETEAMLNAKYYARFFPASEWQRLDIPAPEGYVSSSVAFSDGMLCVRCVNYTILASGAYVMPNGRVETRNYLARWKGLESARYDSSDLRELVPEEGSVRREDTILGLEDVRLCGNTFTATTREFSYCPFNRIVWGTYEIRGDEAIAKFSALRPPGGIETSCEKNWVPLDSSHFVYRWHPLEVYKVGQPQAQQPTVELVAAYPTPRWFRHVRGSTTFTEIEGELWGLVHVVAPHSPRIYLHCLVWLRPGDWALKAYTLPFVLKQVGIEYTLGMAHVEAAEGRPARLAIFASVQDRESWVGEVELQACKKLALPWP